MMTTEKDRYPHCAASPGNFAHGKRPATMKLADGRRHSWIIPASVIFLTMLLSFPAAGEDEWKPATSAGKGAAETAGGGFLPAVVDFFRRYLSPIDGDRCPMYPTCSRYSLDAVHKHGPIMGWIMTCDRLLRCGRDELSMAPRIVTDDGLRCYDPVENNDFWRTR